MVRQSSYVFGYIIFIEAAWLISVIMECRAPPVLKHDRPREERLSILRLAVVAAFARSHDNHRCLYGLRESSAQRVGETMTTLLLLTNW